MGKKIKMSKILFDSHCHLYDSHYNEYKDELIKEIEDSDIRFLTDIGTDYFTWLSVLEDISRYSFCYGTIGCYPEDTGLCPADIFAVLCENLEAFPKMLWDNPAAFPKMQANVDKTEEIPSECLKKLENLGFSEYEAFVKEQKKVIFDLQKAKYVQKYEKLREIVDNSFEKVPFCQNWAADQEIPFSSNGAPVMSEELLSLMEDIYRTNDRIVAIGEIGLDYHDPAWYAPRDVQRYWFRRQLQLAVRLGAPVCIHTRDADEETFNILKEEALGKTKVLLHCYSGSAELAKEYVKHGAMISLSGTLTYKNARKTIEVAQTIPLEKLLIETDAPYLTPVPNRGQTNKPQYVAHTCAKLAEIKGISYEEVGRVTAENAIEFYGIRNMI